MDNIQEWSKIKLKILDYYLDVYRNIMKSTEEKYSVKWNYTYIDAFCGPGLHIDDDKIIDGSPLIAIKKDFFNEYIFIDTDVKKMNNLKKTIQTNIDVDLKNIEYIKMDSNRYILNNLDIRNSYKYVCFLDPYGSHLEWQVVEKLVQTENADLIIHFSIMDLRRNLENESSKERIDKFFGSTKWCGIVHTDKETLFGKQEEKITDYENKLLNHYIENIRSLTKKIFVTEKPLKLTNSKNASLYYLIFTSPKEAGLKVATQAIKKFQKEANDVPKKYKNRMDSSNMEPDNGLF